MGLGQKTGVPGTGRTLGGGLRKRGRKLDSCPGRSSVENKYLGMGVGLTIWCFLFRTGPPKKISPFHGPRLGLALTMTMKEERMAVSSSEEWDKYSKSAGPAGSSKGCGQNPESSEETTQHEKTGPPCQPQPLLCSGVAGA